jgi:hypothetical protein
MKLGSPANSTDCVPQSAATSSASTKRSMQHEQGGVDNCLWSALCQAV